MRTVMYFLVSGAVAAAMVLGLAMLFATRIPAPAAEPDHDSLAEVAVLELLAHNLAQRPVKAEGACPVSGHEGVSGVPFREALKRLGHPDFTVERPTKGMPLPPATKRLVKRSPTVLEV